MKLSNLRETENGLSGRINSKLLNFVLKRTAKKVEKRLARAAKGKEVYHTCIDLNITLDYKDKEDEKDKD